MKLEQWVLSAHVVIVKASQSRIPIIDSAEGHNLDGDSLNLVGSQKGRPHTGEAVHHSLEGDHGSIS